MTDKRTLLGEMEVRIVGTEYARARIQDGADARLRREPRNEHDANAIRVTNATGRKIGYIPRETARWLAPLMDQGKVWIEAVVGAAGEPAQTTPHFRPEEGRLTLAIHLTEAGEDILRPLPDPTTTEAIVHEMVRGAFNRLGEVDNPETVRSLAGALRGMDNDRLLPGTRLLLKCLESRSRVLERKRLAGTADEAREALRRFVLGSARHYHNLTLFPLSAQNGHDPAYTLLSTAIQEGVAEVTEVSESGSVPTLLVRNKGRMPILIPEGEILVGAKQNRTVNITVIVAAETTFELPVSCVEEGRWQHISRHFQAAYCATPTLRARKTASVLQNRRRMGEAISDQGEVWRNVASHLAACKVSSETGSLTASFEAPPDRVAEYRRELVLPETACGFVFAQGGRIVGMEIFDCPRTLHALWPRLSDAYLLEAAALPKKNAPATRAEAERFVTRSADRLQVAPHTIGGGIQIEVAEKGQVGSGVWFNGRLCHLSVFAVES